MLSRDDRDFFADRLAVVTPLLHNYVTSQYVGKHKQNSFSANIELLRSTKRIEKTNAKCQIENFEELADDYAARINRIPEYHGHISPKSFELVASAGIEFPSISKYGIKGVDARLRSTKWWTKKLYTEHLRLLEKQAIDLGKVHSKSDKYISSESVKMYLQRKRRNQNILKRLYAVNVDTGEFFPLKSAIDKSVSNPEIRRFEMMNRISGMDEKSVLEGQEAVFYTLTAPSRQHAVLSKSGLINPLYEGETPRETHKQLCQKWANFRALAALKGIEYSGLRVTEPHHDGTPHWHVLIFTNKCNIGPMTDMLKKYYLLDDCPNEKGAKKRRVTVELIDRKRGSAVGYVAKYISKNIDGYGLDDVEIKDSDRVVSWSSLWGIRQFQFFGGPSVTVWRQLRGCKVDDININFLELYNICINSDWSSYMTHSEKNNVNSTYETEKEGGVYGEDVTRLSGVALNGEEMRTNHDQFEIEFFDSKSSEIIYL